MIILAWIIQILLIIALFALVKGLMDGVDETKAERPKVAQPVSYGLSRWELNHIVGQVLRNDRKGMWRVG